MNEVVEDFVKALTLLINVGVFAIIIGFVIFVALQIIDGVKDKNE